MEQGCPHNPNTDGVCEICGEILGYTRGYENAYREKGPPTRSTIFNAAELPPALAESYGRILAKISHVEHNGRRLASYYALYHAYMENGAPQPPEVIMQLAGLTKKEARKTFTLFAESKTGYRPPDIELKPRHYIVPYFEILELCSQDVQPCIAACIELEQYPELLADHPPQKIAAAVVFHYSKLLAIPAKLASAKGLDEIAFAEIVGVTQGALRSLEKKIGSFLPPVVHR